MNFDLTAADALLSTTRSVRKRLDLSRPVPRETILECLQLAVQAPTGSNSQTWRWVVVDDPAKRARLGELYRQGGQAYFEQLVPMLAANGPSQTQRVFDSALWLLEHLGEVPVHVIACIEGRLPDGTPEGTRAARYGSIFPAVWSFQLALRARGLGSTLTTLHLAHEAEAAELLGIPEHVQQVALLPVAYTQGADFKPAKRGPVSEITHWNEW